MMYTYIPRICVEMLPYVAATITSSVLYALFIRLLSIRSLRTKQDLVSLRYNYDKQVVQTSRRRNRTDRRPEIMRE